jgi:hypothetical protein
MPKHVPLVSTVVLRKGKRVYPPVGKPFNFEDHEVDTIRALHPTGLRRPVNESTVDDEIDDDPEGVDAQQDEATDETAPDKKVKAGSANKTPKQKKKTAKASEDDASNEDEDI